MCKAIREGDEMACSCGLRWDIDEPDPHTDDVIGVDPGHPAGDRSVVNGHVLYRDFDFDEENEFSTVGIAVIDGGLQVCKLCGEYESGLTSPCKGSKVDDDVGPHTGYENPTICYQCDKEVPYVFADSRCKDCTRLTPDEMKGEE